ncbi:MAG: phosphatidylserine decarboxylase family protein [Phycisphaerales bacterium]|nr:phosphatidylserine decarboxylase family protein [Phycisphaerales bacterium]
MRVPLHPAGGREIALILLLFGGLAAIAFGFVLAGFAWFWPIGGLAILLGGGGVLFFRDPERTPPTEPGIFVAPADGKLVEATALDHHPDIGGPATRIGIFLSVFNVHVNRSPCAGVVRTIRYEPGQFLDARDPQSSSKNEANTLVIEPDEPMGGPVVVRQIAGLIARRVICTLKVGDRIEIGQRIGLIKFGSRTELIVPGHDQFKIVAPMGKQVRGASTILARRQPLTEPVDTVRQTAEVS